MRGIKQCNREECLWWADSSNRLDTAEERIWAGGCLNKILNNWKAREKDCKKNKKTKKQNIQGLSWEYKEKKEKNRRNIWRNNHWENCPNWCQLPNHRTRSSEIIRQDKCQENYAWAHHSQTRKSKMKFLKGGVGGGRTSSYLYRNQ